MKPIVLRSPMESGGGRGKPFDTAHEKNGPRQGKKLLKMLYVEDDAQVASTTMKIAKRAVDTGGVRHAENGRKALEILKESEVFDLILLDLRMPEMDGIGVIRRLMGEGRKDLLDKIIVMSGTPGDLQEDPEAAGAVGHRVLNKPIEAGKLLGLFKLIADGWGAGPSFDGVRE